MCIWWQPVDETFAAIPQELRDLPNWILWRSEARKGKRTKVPYSARNEKPARVNDPRTWCDFFSALARLRKGGFHGLGFVFSDQFVGVDMDGVRSADGTLEPQAEEIVKRLDSYAETSPSGTGVHVIVKAAFDGSRQLGLGGPHHEIAVYGQGSNRYFAMTGQRVAGNACVADRTAELAQVIRRFFKPQETKKTARASPPPDRGDDALIDRALRADAKLARLWCGDWEDEFDSQSEADMSLCCKLAFYCGRDAARVDAQFRRSAMMRDKWDRADYAVRTINGAIDRITEIYRPKKNAPATATASVAVDKIPATIELLNACLLFGGGVRFAAVAAKGSMIVATFDNGRQAIWPSVRDLLNFTTSQSIIASATQVVIPTPPRRSGKTVWEPVAALILRLAGADLISDAETLADEFGDILLTTWKRAGCPTAMDDQAFLVKLRICSTRSREPHGPPPECAIWIDTEAVYVHQQSLADHLSTPGGKNRHYPPAELTNALSLLGFKRRQIHRSVSNEHGKARLWVGPLDLLTDDESG
jgi:hypothetical protein